MRLTVTLILSLLAAFAAADSPSLAPVNIWGNNAFSCLGDSYSGTIDPTYTGTPPPSAASFQLSTDPVSQQWWVVFGGQIQYANSTGAWTYIPGAGWFNIAGVTYAKEVLYQSYAQDVSTDPCFYYNFGLIYDITSCTCQLASGIKALNLDKPTCRALYAPHLGPHAAGLIPVAWDFSQHFLDFQAGGALDVNNPPALTFGHYHADGLQCTLSFTPPTFTVPAAQVVPVDFCAIFDSPTCSPPRP